MLIYLVVFSNEEVVRCVCAHAYKQLAEEHCRMANTHVRQSMASSPYDMYWIPGDDGAYSVVTTPLIGLFS